MGNQAAADLDYLKRTLERTQTRVDPHAFHFILWGALVLLCYPVLNWLELNERWSLMRWIGISALVTGALGSSLFEIRLTRKPRLKAENTFVVKQIVMIVYPNIILASILSAIGPATGVLPGPYVGVLWGFVYANMMFMVGVVYTREYVIAGATICVGAFLALFMPHYSHFILAPFMGLGTMIPGIIAERRVARMRADEA